MASPLVTVRTTRAAIKGYMVDAIRTPDADGTYPTLVGPRAYPDRYGPFDSQELPAIALFAIEETSEFLDVTQDRRHLKVSIEIQAAGDDADTQLDIISGQIEDLFRNDEYLGGFDDGLVEWCRYSRGNLYYDEKRHFNGICWMLEYEVRYLWQTTPEPWVSNIAPFATVEATYSFAEGDPQAPIVIAQAGSEIDLPQV